MFSDSWHRVSGLMLRLRAHLDFHRHRYRGELWYVLRDPSGDRYNRFTPRTHAFIQRIDGSRTIGEVWQSVCTDLGDDAPTQNEVLHLLAQLHSADALSGDESPDLEELFKRYHTVTRRKLMGKLMSPLFMQFSLFDPERFLVRTISKVRWVFDTPGILLWCLVVGAGAVLGAMNLDGLTDGFSDRVFATQNLFVLWFVYPVIKVLHELGHAYAVKRFGGEVHDLGILLMIFMPLPFVDASSATAFPSKRERVIVGAAGILVELFLAGIAMLVWVNVEEGLVRAVAYNTIVIAGFSTLLFNGNPLLRYDGYYILSDLIEIPNLRQRSNAQLMWFIERYLCRNRALPKPEATLGERRWFVGFGISSFLYRMTVLAGIILLIASKFFFLGAALAIWSIVTWLGLPLIRGVSFLLSSPRLEQVRARSIATTCVVLLAGVLGMFAVPMPHNTLVEGVLWVPEGAIVRARASGFVDELLAQDGDTVREGQPLVVCSDPELQAQVKGIRARLVELEARYIGAQTDDLVVAAQLKDQLEEAREELRSAEESLADLEIHAPNAGQLVIVLAERFPGMFVDRGQPMGQVIDFDRISVRLVVPQDSVDMVLNESDGVSLRRVQAPEDVIQAKLIRHVPQGSEKLPSSALGSFGGGNIVVDPREESGDLALEAVFELELAMIDPPELLQVGGRVFARFEHEWSPYGPRVYKQVRRLFLSRFDI
jgi:putative peptide zinc metalloprotease protein